jgi:sugar phosphate isomerase/epimerase
MTDVSRRAFGKAIAAGLPLAAVFRSFPLHAAQLSIGVSTFSFRELPRVPGRDNVDDVIAALRAVGATRIELSLQHVEPAPPNTAPVMGGSAAYPKRIVLTPEQVAETNAEAREALRHWRLGVPGRVLEDVRRKFASAGITVHAAAVGFNDSFTDAEIDAVLGQCKALGVSTVSSPLTMACAQRLVPFAERHGVAIAIHNQADGSADGAIDTPRLTQALALSPAFTLKLDIGSLAASNCDAADALRQYRGRVSFVLVRDRLRNGGASQPLGEGDTPIGAVLRVLEESAPSIPALIGYDYLGLRSPVEEVRACLAYLRSSAKPNA